MAYQYFLYKCNMINTIGGIVPPQPTNGDLGLALYNDFYLGRVDGNNLDYLNKIKEYNPIICNEEEANGFKLLGVDKILVDNINNTYRDLTQDEINLKKKAFDFVSKINLRLNVLTKVGDQDDQLSDMAKRLAIVERCLFMLYNECKKQNINIPEPWNEILNNAYTDFNNKTLVDPVDVRPDGYLSVYNILKSRSVTLTEQLTNYYNDTMK